MQNTSHAVMGQRIEPRDSLDDFPSPPWATRAMVQHIIAPGASAQGFSVLEPACGRGHMAQALSEYFGEVHAADVHPYGYGETKDFLTSSHAPGSFDWVITNPPFKIAQEFLHRAFPIARRGIAILERTTFIEGIGRYQTLFSARPPAIIAPFAERVPMVKGRVDASASSATSYSWFVWLKEAAGEPVVRWIPPCRKTLERNDDYLPSFVASPGKLLPGCGAATVGCVMNARAANAG